MKKFFTTLMVCVALAQSIHSVHATKDDSTVTMPERDELEQFFFEHDLEDLVHESDILDDLYVKNLGPINIAYIIYNVSLPRACEVPGCKCTCVGEADIEIQDKIYDVLRAAIPNQCKALKEINRCLQDLRECDDETSLTDSKEENQ